MNRLWLRVLHEDGEIGPWVRLDVLGTDEQLSEAIVDLRRKWPRERPDRREFLILSTAEEPVHA